MIAPICKKDERMIKLVCRRVAAVIQNVSVCCHVGFGYNF